VRLRPPPFFFTKYTSNWPTTVPANGILGTSFTVGVSGAEGTPVALLAAPLTHDVHFVVLRFAGGNISTNDYDAIADILWDPAGGTSWSELIPSLLYGFTPSLSTTIGFTLRYFFPLFIPAGANLAVRGKKTTATAGTTDRCLIELFGHPNIPGRWWCGQKVVPFGITEGSAHGARITTGTGGAFGSWTNVGAVTPARLGAIQMGVGPSDSAALANGHFWEVGYNSTKLPGSPTWYNTNNTSEAGKRDFGFPVWCDIPPGVQLQVRGKVGGSSEDHDVALYGVY
jgi:hypothetical protein